MSTSIESELISRLREVAGRDAVVTGEAELRIFAQDALRGRGGIVETPLQPLAIVRPAGAEATSKILALATASGLPVVTYGAGTGLMGGARTAKPGIVLDTVRLNRISVQAEDRIVWAGSGAILKDVDEALRGHGMCLGHDPWTFPVATVGGALGTNGLGYKGGRYGGMGDHAIALEVVLADGTLFRTRAVRRHSAGPNLVRLFVGAEGTFGVITAAALLANPVPEKEERRAFNFTTFEHGFGAIQELAALGLRPALLEYGEEHASPWPQLLQREEDPPLLYLGYEGFAEEVEAAWARTRRILGAHGATELPQSDAEAFWAQRHVIAERFARGMPRERRFGGGQIARDFMHVALLPSKVLGFRRDAHEICQHEGVALLDCGLWTAPDFFSSGLALPDTMGGSERLSQVMDMLLHRAQELGGSMEYVHGAGIRLAHLMPEEHGEALDVIRRIKAAIDPAGVLNPGKLGL